MFFAKLTQPTNQTPKGFDDAVGTVWLSTPGDKPPSTGMYQAIKSLYNEKGKKRKLYLAGHSLGGALATNAAARLAYLDDMDIAGIYTIGSPRFVGAGAGACARPRRVFLSLSCRRFSREVDNTLAFFGVTTGRFFSRAPLHALKTPRRFVPFALKRARVLCLETSHSDPSRAGIHALA